MLQVRKTKYPSFRQMEKMAINLRNKYKTFATIQIFTYAHKDGRVENLFWMSVKDNFHTHKESWDGLWLSYRYRMMKGV